MPDILYNLSTGISQVNLANLRIDTLERLNNLSNLHIPNYQLPSQEKIYIPKDLSSDDILLNKKNTSLKVKDMLSSSNPDVVNMGRSIMEQEANSQYTASGKGLDTYVKYQPGQEKFTENHLWKENKQTMYGFDPYKSIEGNENFLHNQLWNNYSFGGKLWRGIGTFAGRILSKFATGLVGTVGDLGSMAWNGLQELGDIMNINNGTKNNFWDDVSNNWLARKMEEVDEYTKQHILPTYKAIDYDNKGAWSKLFDPYTWQNDYADGAGFLLQFAVPGTIFGKAASAGKLARSIAIAEEAGDIAKATELATKAGKTIGQAKNVGAFSKAMGVEISNKFGKGAAEFLTGSDNLGGISAHIFNTSMEAVAVTKEGFNQTVKNLMDKGWSKEEAIKEAGNNAPGQFYMNLAILTASNAFQNKLLQKAIGNRMLTNTDKLTLGTLPKTNTNKFFTANKWGNRIKFYGTNAPKSILMEGYWEENAQTAASRWAAGEYTRRGEDGEKLIKTEGGISGFLNQLKNQTIDATKGNDREAADSIMAGAVIGILGNTVFSKLAGERKEIKDSEGNIIKKRTFLPEGQRKLEQRENAQKVSKFINTRDAWLSLKSLDSELYNDDKTINEDKVKQRTEEIKEKLSKAGLVFSNTLTSESLTDPNQRKLLQNKVFASYVKAHILNNTGEALISSLKDWNSKSKEELEMYGVTEEAAENSDKWAKTAKNLVDVYDKIKDKIYVAPSDTNLEEYQQNTQAIHSLLFDYTAYKTMSENIAKDYSDIIDENNPFEQYPLVQEYNENVVLLYKLNQKLKDENLDIIQRDVINKQIEDINKKQSEQKKTIDQSGESKESSEGLYFPKNSDKFNESENIAKNEIYFNALNNKIDFELEANKYETLIDDYSDVNKGYQKYLDTVDFWNKAYNKPIDEKIEEEEVKEDIQTKDTLKERVATLKSQLETATTQEERDNIEKEIESIEKEIETLTEVTPEEVVDTEIEVELPTEIQYGIDDYSEQALAIDTPFKTVNKETIDAKDDNNEKIWDKEIATNSGYDHDLTIFFKKYLSDITKNPDKYELFVIKDTLELMKERLSKKQMESFDEGEFKAGAIVVFREKGKTDWLKFDNGKTIAASYNKTAFNTNIDKRISGNAKKTNRTEDEVKKFFNQEQTILEAVREKVINDNVQIQIKSESGSLGVYPITEAKTALERFGNFADKENILTIIKPDTKNKVPYSEEGQVYLNIPASNTVDKIDYFIPVYTSVLQLSDNAESIQSKIYRSIANIQFHTFKSKKEASNVIVNYLYNLFYIGDISKFDIIKSGDGWKIVHVDSKGQTNIWVNKVRLKVSDKLYNTEEGFNLYENINGEYAPTQKISKDQYREFIHNHLLTNRKIVVQSKNNTEKLFTQPVNAYLNLSLVNNEDILAGNATQTTENELITLNITDFNNTFSEEIEQSKQENIELEQENIELEQSDIETKKADIERRRQEELNTQTTAGYGVIAADYLFTGGRGSMLSTDYLLQALTSCFEYAGKQIDTIRNKYAAELGNIKDNVGTEVYNKMMQEIKDVINNTYQNKKAEELFDKILDNATGFVSREGNQVSIELETLNESHKNNINAKYDAELKALEQPIEESKIELLEKQLKIAKENGLKTLEAVISKNLEKAKEEENKKEPETITDELLSLLNEEEASTKNVANIVPHIFDGNAFKIDFENDEITGNIEDIDPNEFYESFSNKLYKKTTIENNGLNYYFVKNLNLNKFVSFDSNMKIYKTTELPQEITQKSEFKEIENCN